MTGKRHDGRNKKNKKIKIMAELNRTFTLRSPEVLSRNDINSFGISSHPEIYQSGTFKDWVKLCQENNLEELDIRIVEYLRSSQSIKKVGDLGNGWSSIINSFISQGSEINKEKAYQIIKNSRVELFSGKEKNANPYFAIRTAVADTMLGLSYLKKLSFKGNIDYQTILKIMSLVETCINQKFELPEINLRPYFVRPILLPPCFFKLDPCNNKPKSVDSAFSFLDNKSTRPPEKIKPSGCINNGECTCKVNDECVEQSTCCAKIKLNIIDLMVVKDYTKCYQAGDLSYIKNILAGEVLETKHRRLERTEEFTETEEDIKTFEERYLQTEEKSSLQKEIENISKKDTAFNAGVTTNYEYGSEKFGKFTAEATTNFSFAQSKTDSNKEVRDYSKDIVDRATKSVEEKIRKLVSTRRLFETEEINDHSFQNVGGPNISGQYLYVNKVSKAQVFNYGKKAAIEIYLPEPSSLFKKLLETKFEGTKPIEPIANDIDPKTITSENYISIANQYGIKDIEAPPGNVKDVSVRINGQIDKKQAGKYNPRTDISVSIPDNYESISMDWAISSFNWNDSGKTSMGATLGGSSLIVSWGGTSNSQTTLPPLEGNQPISFYVWGVRDYDLVLTVHCQLKNEFLAEWQMGIYEKILAVQKDRLEKYQKELEKYQKELKEFELKEAELKAERYNKNPFINRETERTELKRMAISYISCQFFDQFDAMKNRVKPCGYPEMNIREAEEEGRFIQFFEQAFNWNLLTYIFYPYFWGRKCTWEDKLKEESNDLIFQKFLSAGSCRVLVPVRDGFFDYVQYFLTTGEIWGQSGVPPIPNDPHYVSLAQELKEQKGNYFADREGSIDAIDGDNFVTLNNTNHYWTFANSLATPPIIAGLNTLNINVDKDREIILDCKIYRIVDIQPNPAVTNHSSWLITLDRSYVGNVDDPNADLNMKWSTGAVFIGAPWEFITPTTLTFLRDKSPCLPTYPLKECKE